MTSNYQFETSLYCEFTTPKLDKIKFPMIAEYTVDYDGSIYIDRIVTASRPPKAMEITIMHFLNGLKDFDHLINEIEEIEKAKQEAKELSRLSGGEF